MYKSKDFILMDVVNIEGKKVGVIKDILIDFNKGFIIGFSILPINIFKKNLCVLKENIITFNSNMVVKDTTEEEKFKFSNLKGMDVINSKGDVIGMVEDVIFNNNDFKIKGVVISTGFIRNLIYGKKVYLINQLILGEENILYFKEKNNICINSMPHKLLDVYKNE